MTNKIEKKLKGDDKKRERERERWWLKCMLNPKK